MEEKLSDKILKEIYREFYISKDYQLSLSNSKRMYRLLMRNDNINTNDKFYIYMILMIIIKSYKKLNRIQESFKYIHLSIHFAQMEYQKMESYRYLIEYYNKKGNKAKAEYYFRKYEEYCIKIGEYQSLVRLLDIKS